jgi:dGTPase
MLASYATNPDKSKGRKFFELPDLYRNNFEKDRERIIHSNSFFWKVCTVVQYEVKVI